MWMKEACINIKYSSGSIRHFTSIILTSLMQIWNLYCLDLSVKVFSVTKSQFNKQSVELSILLTLSKYFACPKFVFTFDLISSSVESSITKKKTLAKIACFFFSFLQPFRKRIMKNCTSSKTHDISFPPTVRYRRYRRQD